ADLLRDYLPVQLHGPASRRGNALLQPQIGGVFGRGADPAPPQDRAAFDDVVQPGLADLFGADAAWIAAIRERTREHERARNVVVRHHEVGLVFGRVEPAVHIVIDGPEFAAYPFVAPAFDRAAEIHPDQLAE